MKDRLDFFGISTIGVMLAVCCDDVVSFVLELPGNVVNSFGIGELGLGVLVDCRGVDFRSVERANWNIDCVGFRACPRARACAAIDCIF